MKTEKQIPGILSELGLFSGRMCEMQPWFVILTLGAIATLIVSMQLLICLFACFILNKL